MGRLSTTKCTYLPTYQGTAFTTWEKCARIAS